MGFSSIRFAALNRLCLLWFAGLFIWVSVAWSEELSFEANTDKLVYTPGDTLIVSVEFDIQEGYHMYSNPKGPGIGKPLVISPSNHPGLEWLSAEKAESEKFKPDIGEWVWAYKDEAGFFIRGVLDTSLERDTLDISINFNGVLCRISCIPFDKDVDLRIPVSEEGEGNPEFHADFEGYTPVELNLPGSLQAGAGNREEGIASLEFESSAGSDEDTVHSRGGMGTSDSDVDKVEAVFSPSSYTPVEKKTEFNLFLALFFAFIAGVILNLMPCVLPVLGLKILSFSGGRESSKGEAVKSSLVFSAGMISVYLILAALASVAGYSWGEQFRNPSNLMLIIAAIVVFSLGMFDVYTLILPSSIVNKESKVSRKEGVIPEFIRGMFATLLATPCSGPFLGATLAWTLSQPPYIIYLVYLALGSGMASPYILLSASDRARRAIPRPGKWMDDLKHFMGFLLLGFGVYLAAGLPGDWIIPLLSFSLILSFGVSLFSRFAPFGSSLRRRLWVWAAVIAIGGAGWYFSVEVVKGSVSVDMKSESSEGDALYTWEEFSHQRLRQAHKKGRDVIVNFTADWCMNCKYNELTVYRNSEIQRLLKEKDVLFLKADLTGDNPEAEEFLKSLGSESVPFMALFKGDEPERPVIMRDIISKGRLKRALQTLD